MFSPDCTEALLSYTWPGNVRELVNAIERAVASASSATTLFRKHLPPEIRIQLARASTVDKSPINDETNIFSSHTLPTLKALRASIYEKAEKQYLMDLLRITAGDIVKACEISDLSQPRLYELLRKHKISTNEKITRRARECGDLR